MSTDSPSSAAESLSKLLSQLDEEHRTGILETLDGTTGELTRIHLRRGHVVAVQQTTGRGGWILAEYLLRSGTIETRALLAARKVAQRSDVPLEDALVQRKDVSPDVLKRFVDLQTAEMLLPLFRKRGLSIRFVEERPHPSPYATALPISYVLKEAERVNTRWPQTRQRVGRPEAIFEKEGNVLAEMLGHELPDREEEPLPDLSANARLVYFFVNGERTIEQIARSSGITVFDAMSAMKELLDAYLISLVTTHGPGETIGDTGSRIPMMVSVAMWVLLAGLLAAAVPQVTRVAAISSLEIASSSPSIDAVVEDTRWASLHQGLQLHELHHGSYPTTLPMLIEAGYLHPASAAILSHARYRRVEGGYTLVYRP